MWVLHTFIPNEYISTNMILDNYDGFVDLREHVQNVRKNFELVIQDGDAMYKILLMTFKGSAWAWYNNLKLGSIMGFNDLCVKHVSQFSTNIHVKRSSIKLFGVT